MKKITASVNKSRKRIPGAGRKAENVELEIKVMDWFQARREKNTLSAQLIAAAIIQIIFFSFFKNLGQKIEKFVAADAIFFYSYL